MAFGEFSRYCLIFGCSVLGGLTGYWYSSAPANLRIKLEKQKRKLLRPGDPLYLYGRNIIKNKDTIKSLNIKGFTGDIGAEATDEQAIALNNWCTDNLFKSPRFLSEKMASDLATHCEWNGG
ncbi:hypothetical protein A6V39_04175 [Candidatus Mycoplasma haematobovis]|uniref:Uncharacterized protein n=1 Tax=Candidatus Mycoplasma haematobovis TaxID=432608 RepID=A0A1A9QDQ4_9MOLU|nr:hypothetical protein [Candidatus Mycoplasma haematobovis]OAL10086.1 hypothetical protein A6V39_04175 [Candidatus Mycoplasma haematobovis]